MTHQTKHNTFCAHLKRPDSIGWGFSNPGQEDLSLYIFFADLVFTAPEKPQPGPPLQAGHGAVMLKHGRKHLHQQNEVAFSGQLSAFAHSMD